MNKLRTLLTLLMATVITAGQLLLVVNDTGAHHRHIEQRPSSA